ncbi:MAG: cytochrome c3 family protein [Anaerolineae bacterium]|nr:cytochrome c3 family protein [Gemmatimonadaceae bacterium]
MTTTMRKWAAIPGLLALAAAAVVLSAYSGASSDEGRDIEQPLPFPHPVHVKTLAMNCMYCHFAAGKSPDPGLPAVATCMGCHITVGPKKPDGSARPGVATLQEFWKKGQPIPWVRIHKVPDYVQFPHMRHVNAGVSCQTCHGQVQDMQRVTQVASLNMGWCVQCHLGESNPPFKARYDCSTCHY